MKDLVSANSTSKNIVDLFLRLSSTMLSYDNQDDFFENTLSEIGKSLKVERTYVFEFNSKIWKSVCSWSNESSSDMTQFEDGGETVSNAFVNDGMIDVFNSGLPYIIEDIELVQSDDARAFLKKQKIVNMVLVPLFSDGKLTAFFGVDQCKQLENWASDNINTMITIGYLLNNAIQYFNAIDFLQRKEAEAQSLIDILPFPIFITNPETNNFLCYNKTLVDIAIGEDVASSTCHKIMYDLDKPCSFCKTKFLAPKGESVVWDSFNPKFNANFKVINTCIPWDDIENARLTIALDITDSLRLQREQVLERESSMAKGRFLANMSHELRTPLNGIIGMTHLAIQSNEDYRVGNYLKKIQDSSRNLLYVINDILDFSKMEAGKLELEQHPFSPLDVFTTVKEHLLEDARMKGISLQYQIEKNISSLLVGDALRLSQVVHQLVKNAIKFTEEGHVVYSLSLLESREDTGSEVLCVKVEDTGIGISEEDLKNLFVGFSQADASSTRRYGGTGLGLAIVEGLVELMGGTISVESVEGKGTTFTCQIPFVVANTNVINETITPLNNNLEGVSVLLAEDNEINSLIAYEMLTQMKCTVDCVQDGHEVLAALEKNKYDIVLMDVQMPQMDGLEATQIIRQNEKYNNLPIVALTAHVLKEEIDKCYKAGMQSHVHKPISVNALHRAIADYTKNEFKFK